MADENKITLTIHGLQAFGGEIDAEVFAEKFTAFLKGLASSDEAANGAKVLKFILSDLRKNTATAVLSERQAKPTSEPINSGIDFFADSLSLIRENSPKARRLPKLLVEQVVLLNKGVTKRFEFGEIKFRDREPLLLDKFLEERAKRVLSDIKDAETNLGFYAGDVYASFDGVLKAVDFQTAAKRGTLRLSIGEVPILCNLSGVDIKDVREALDQRARFYGRAAYDSGHPFPTMFDVTKIEVIPDGSGLQGWRGSFAGLNDDAGWGNE